MESEQIKKEELEMTDVKKSEGVTAGKNNSVSPIYPSHPDGNTQTPVVKDITKNTKMTDEKIQELDKLV